MPVGVFGTFWAHIKLHDTVRKRARVDWWGNLTFAIGLVSVLVGITYGIQPYKNHTMGWTNPWVLAAPVGGGLIFLPADHAAYLTGRGFFPRLITQPFHDGLTIAFWFAIAACVIAAIASIVTQRRKTAHRQAEHESPGSELVGVTGGAGVTIGEPLVPQMVPDLAQRPRTAPMRPAEPAPASSNGRRGPAIAGLVHDGSGAPVAAAAVTITGPDGHQFERTTTGSDGRYLVAVSPGDHLVIVTAPGRVPQAATVVVGEFAVARDFPLVLDEAPPAGELYGVVRSPQGVPLTGVTTTVTDENGEVVATAVTGPDGGYRITGLADGHYTLVAAGHRPATVTVQIGSAESATVHVALGE